jgi:hypothetical protein
MVTTSSSYQHFQQTDALSRSKQKEHAAKKTKHPGFKAAAKQIASKEAIPDKAAAAILASAARKASPAAKQANPKLKKVK